METIEFDQSRRSVPQRQTKTEKRRIRSRSTKELHFPLCHNRWSLSTHHYTTEKRNAPLLFQTWQGLKATTLSGAHNPTARKETPIWSCPSFSNDTQLLQPPWLERKKQGWHVHDGVGSRMDTTKDSVLPTSHNKGRVFLHTQREKQLILLLNDFCFAPASLTS